MLRFDGVSFTQQVGNVTIRPIFSLQAGFQNSIKIRGATSTFSTNDRISVVNFNANKYDGCTAATENSLDNIFEKHLQAIEPVVTSSSSGDFAIFSNLTAKTPGKYHLCLHKSTLDAFVDVGMLSVNPYVNSTHKVLLSIGFASSILIRGYGLNVKNRMKIISEDRNCSTMKGSERTLGAPVIDFIAPSIEANGHIAIFSNIIATTTDNYTLCYCFDSDRCSFHNLVGKLQIACGHGLSSRKGSSLCSKCPPGYYKNAEKGLSDCLACLKGKYSVEFGSDKCHDCLPEGMLQKTTGGWIAYDAKQAILVIKVEQACVKIVPQENTPARRLN